MTAESPVEGELGEDTFLNSCKLNAWLLQIPFHLMIHPYPRRQDPRFSPKFPLVVLSLSKLTWLSLQGFSHPRAQGCGIIACTLSFLRLSLSSLGQPEAELGVGEIWMVLL